MDSLPVEFAFRNPIVIGIPDSLLLAERKAQDSEIRISLHCTKGVSRPSSVLYQRTNFLAEHFFPIGLFNWYC